MKTYHARKGHVLGYTLTVGELIEVLKMYHPDRPVMATWEGVNAYIRPENFTVAMTHKGDKNDEEMTVIIEVDEY